MLELNLPPTLHDLLQNPIYKKYFLTVPPPTVGQTWQVWGLKFNEKWAGRIVETYREGVLLAKKLLRDGEYRDVVVSSRTTEYLPPRGFRLATWCGRCRRPTVYIPNSNHPALRRAPIISDASASRCFYCGIRKETSHFYTQV